MVLPLSREDKDYLASVVRTFARDVDDIWLTLHQNTELGLAAARRVAALLQQQGRTAAQAHQIVSAAAKTAWRQDRQFAEVLAEDESNRPTWAQIQAEVDAQRADSENLATERAGKLQSLPGFQPVIWARARLRFGPGRTCEPIARLLDRAIVRAEAAGLDPRLLVVADGHAQAGEDIVRVRRKAHGVADWIRSPTCQVRIVLRPAGLHASVPPAASGSAPAATAPSGPAASPGLAAPPGTLAPPGPEAAAVRDALAEVIDPDLGVGVVDLGFVRTVAVEERTAIITMTLTSAACPLTGVLEDQIRAVLAPLSCVDGFRVDWQWIPAWRPADITESGRDQLRAIGFTI